MNRNLQIIGIVLVVLMSIGWGFPTPTPELSQDSMGRIKIVNSHVRGSDTFPGCKKLPIAREYGVCFIAYPPYDPVSWAKPMFDMVLARDEETTIYQLPPGTYRLQEWQADSEINLDPLYSPCGRTYVRPPETIIIKPGTTIVFGSERTLPAPGEFVEGRTINPNCGGFWSEPAGTPTDTPTVSPAVTPNPTQMRYLGGFAGRWSTNWGDMTCRVDGLRVHCAYTHDQGRIDATLSVDGRTMEGQWTEAPSYSPPHDGGRVTFTLSEDGNAIDGQWWYGKDSGGGSWTGTRTAYPAETPIPAPTPNPTPNPTEVAYVGGFSGQWDTNWGDMTCNADGARVHCEYTHDQGRIDATLSVDGRMMEGQWAESPSYSPPNDGGRVTFTLSEDGSAIDGTWCYGQDGGGGTWTGTRK